VPAPAADDHQNFTGAQKKAANAHHSSSAAHNSSLSPAENENSPCLCRSDPMILAKVDSKLCHPIPPFYKAKLFYEFPCNWSKPRTKFHEIKLLLDSPCHLLCMQMQNCS
jgi:hypothetical protein